ncbi:MAG TPA: hypothetical protein VIH57_00285 [Bacteroidales bacterium]
MSQLKEKASIIDAYIRKELNALGFFEIDQYVFQKKLDEFSTGMIIIEKTDRRSRHTWFLSPTVGLINSRVEELYVELVDFIKDPTKLFTAMTSIGYLLPQADYKVWEFPINFSNEQIQLVVNDFILETQNHILPLLDKSLDLNHLLLLLQREKFGIMVFNNFKIPIIHYLLGEKDKGMQFINDVLNRARPSPKDPTRIIPLTFSSLEEISQYFRKDKDVKYYYHYLNFSVKYRNL